MVFEIRKNRKPQGRKKLVAERAAYFELVQQGVSFKEAARLVGVDVRTGKKWRNGDHGTSTRKAKPPADTVVSPSGPSRYLREADRIHIADRLREKASVRQIARELGRALSTISREITRNRTVLEKYGRWYYRPYAAQSRADARRPRPKGGKIGANKELRDFIQDHLVQRWSPEQICQALRKRFPGRPEMHVVHETIYQALYVQGRGELRRELTKALRTGRARRRPHRLAHTRQRRAISDMVMISDRPAEADDRAVPGHWEGDLIIGKEHASAIGTLVERSTRYSPTPSRPCRNI